jgi:DnaJ homolog subfamily C member 7
VDALADCGRARALNPGFHRVLRRLSKIHEELGRPGQAAECLEELKTLGSVNASESAELDRSIMHLSAKKRLESMPHHFRMLNVPTSAGV